MIKEIIIWIIVLVLAGLIINFLISPNSLDNIKYKISKFLEESQESKLNKIGINITKEEKKDVLDYEEIKTEAFCKEYELMAKNLRIGINDFKESACSGRCLIDNLEYYTFNCDDDKLICYCLK